MIVLLFSPLPTVLVELQKADLISGRECKRIGVISDVLYYQSDKSPKVLIGTADILKRHGHSKESSLLSGKQMYPSSIFFVMLYVCGSYIVVTAILVTLECTSDIGDSAAFKMHNNPHLHTGFETQRHCPSHVTVTSLPADKVDKVYMML